MTATKKKQEEQIPSAVQAEKKETAVTETVTGEVISQTFTPEEEESYRSLCKEIEEEMSKMENSAILIALKLSIIYRKKLYEVGNYVNIYDMAVT